MVIINNEEAILKAMNGRGGWICRKTGTVYRRVIWDGEYYAHNDEDFQIDPYGTPDVKAFICSLRSTDSYADTAKYAMIPSMHQCYVMSRFVYDYEPRFKTIFTMYGLYSFPEMQRCPMYADPFRIPLMCERELQFFDSFSRMIEEYSQINAEFDTYENHIMIPRIIQQWCEANGFEPLVRKESLSDT